VTVEFSCFNPSSHSDEQRDLFEVCFPETIASGAHTESHHSWKFNSSEYRSYEYTAIEGSDILGYYAAITYPYVLSGEAHSAAMVCDVMTHPKARGKGVFTGLGAYATGELARESLSFSTGYPVRPEVIPGHLKVGWEAHFQLPVYACPLSASKILSRFHLGFFTFLVNPLLLLLNWLFDSRITRVSELSVQTMSVDELLSLESYDEFFGKWSCEQVNYLVKDKHFLAWRLGAPKAEYKIFTLTESGQVVACAITRYTLLDGIPSLAILDFMALSEFKSGLPVLLTEIKLSARRLGAELVAIMMSQSGARKLGLWRSFFLRTPITFTFISKKLAGSVDFSCSADWPLMWIDSDDL
jgi:hypothetical protein